MRTSIQALLTTIAVLVVPATASADFGHVVAPGESLSSVAAADGLSVSQLAAANGLSPDAILVAGSTIQIPPQSQAVSAPAQPAAPAGDETEPATAPQTGSYVVQPGDTLSAIAAANGMTVDQLAADDGLDPSAPLLAGSTLTIGGGSQAGASQGAPSPGSYVVQPGDTLSAIAAANGMTVEPAGGRQRPRPKGLLLAGSTLSVGGGSAASTGPPEHDGRSPERAPSRPPRRSALGRRPDRRGERRARRRWPRRSPTRRAASTTTWCPAPARPA